MDHFGKSALLLKVFTAACRRVIKLFVSVFCNRGRGKRSGLGKEHPDKVGRHPGEHPDEVGRHPGEHPDEVGQHPGENPDKAGRHPGGHPSHPPQRQVLFDVCVAYVAACTRFNRTVKDIPLFDLIHSCYCGLQRRDWEAVQPGGGPDAGRAEAAGPELGQAGPQGWAGVGAGGQQDGRVGPPAGPQHQTRIQQLWQLRYAR